MAYCEDTDVDQFYGKANVDTWADLDDLGTVDGAAEIAARRLYFRNQADAEIDDRLRNGPYTIPFSATYPKAIVELASLLTGVNIYDARRIQDAPDDADTVAKHRDRVEKMFKEIISYVRKLDVELTTASAPRVITQS